MGLRGDRLVRNSPDKQENISEKVMKFLRFLTAFLMALSVYTGAFAQAGAFDVTRMDRSVDACDDFFSFANGNWVKSTPIPPSQSRWGSFNMLSESNRDVLH